MANNISKSWFAVLPNPEEHGCQGTPQEICEKLRDEWIGSSTTRTGAWTYCISANGLPHVHMVLEDVVAMRFTAVKKAYACGVHFEPTKGNKKQAEDYILKRTPYEEKGEKVLCLVRAGEIKGAQGKRSDLDKISELLDDGKTPDQILSEDIHYRKFDKIIRDEYFSRLLQKTPPIRDVQVHWLCGESGSGKSYTFVRLCENVGEDNIYFITDLGNGAFDKYAGQPVLFVDELKETSISYAGLLALIDRYKRQVSANLRTLLHVTPLLHPLSYQEITHRSDVTNYVTTHRYIVTSNQKEPLMTNNKKTELSSESTRQYAFRRLSEGIKQIKNDPHKQIGVLIILALAILSGIIIKHAFRGNLIRSIFEPGVHILNIFITIIYLICYVMYHGTPPNAHKIHNNLARIGLCNTAGEVPLLLKEYPYHSKVIFRQVNCLEFISCGIEKSVWENKKTAIETALNILIARIEETDGKRGIRLYTIPVEQGLSDKLIWKTIMLNTEIPVCKIILGESLLEQVVVDLNVNPHMLIGGSTGSGKTVLLRLILMQLLEKQNIDVTVADFKGGVDFSTSWKKHPRCAMIFNRSELLDYLEQLIIELNRRKDLFASKENCNNIYDYNINPLYTLNDAEPLHRLVFAVDEVAEVLDKTGLDKAAKEQVAQIESRIATIARLGRAFGIHLILATQRPDANILSGQIKNNIAYRICGRADNVLSMIILDNTLAADEIPSDARGRFIDSDGTIFQSYWFDESVINWDAQS